MYEDLDQPWLGDLRSRWSSLGRGSFKFQIFFFNFQPDPWGNDPIWGAYFADGLKPPTIVWFIQANKHQLFFPHGWIIHQYMVSIGIIHDIILIVRIYIYMRYVYCMYKFRFEKNLCSDKHNHKSSYRSWLFGSSWIDMSGSWSQNRRIYTPWKRTNVKYIWTNFQPLVFRGHSLVFGEG